MITPRRRSYSALLLTASAKGWKAVKIIDWQLIVESKQNEIELVTIPATFQRTMAIESGLLKPMPCKLSRT